MYSQKWFVRRTMYMSVVRINYNRTRIKSEKWLLIKLNDNKSQEFVISYQNVWSENFISSLLHFTSPTICILYTTTAIIPNYIIICILCTTRVAWYWF